MKNKSTATDITWLYWGTLITSIGSLTLPAATVGILTQENYTLSQIGIVVALMRFGAMLGSLTLGDLAEKYNTKLVIVFTEILAFIVTIALVLVWNLGQTYFTLFCILFFLRTFVVFIGAPGRNKIIKELSDLYKKDHFNSALILNLVTHGPNLIGALVGFIIVKYLSYDWALWFDAITFLVNGYILLKFVNHQSKKNEVQINSRSVFYKIHIYFSHTNVAIFDILLAIPFMGTNVLMSRLSYGVGYRVPILLTTFGLGVFASIPFLKWRRDYVGEILGYTTLAFSFIFLIFTNHRAFEFIVVGVFMRNISYWYLYNLYTGRLQEAESSNNITSLFAARILIGISIIGAGDYIMGQLSQIISLNFDLMLRLLMTVIPLVLLIFLRFKLKTVEELK